MIRGGAPASRRSRRALVAVACAALLGACSDDGGGGSTAATTTSGAGAPTTTVAGTTTTASAEQQRVRAALVKVEDVGEGYGARPGAADDDPTFSQCMQHPLAAATFPGEVIGPQLKRIAAPGDTIESTGRIGADAPSATAFIQQLQEDTVETCLQLMAQQAAARNDRRALLELRIDPVDVGDGGAMVHISLSIGIGPDARKIDARSLYFRRGNVIVRVSRAVEASTVPAAEVVDLSRKVAARL